MSEEEVPSRPQRYISEADPWIKRCQAFVPICCELWPGISVLKETVSDLEESQCKRHTETFLSQLPWCEVNSPRARKLDRLRFESKSHSLPTSQHWGIIYVTRLCLRNKTEGLSRRFKRTTSAKCPPPPQHSTRQLTSIAQEPLKSSSPQHWEIIPLPP